jgi:maleylpyruvate isomerase
VTTDEMLELIDEATIALLAAVEPMTDADLQAASLLTGWSRGHVLTHLARNADALRNLLVWARTGVETPAYATEDARDADIEAGASRSAAEQFADLQRSCSAFRAEAEELPEQAWQATVAIRGDGIPASNILIRRLTEVVLHHTDLGDGYTRADWPAGYAEMELPEPLATYRATR